MNLAERRANQRERRKSNNATAECEAWNKKYPVGTRVKYSSIRGEESKSDVIGKTRSEAYGICGHASVLITGKSGGVSLDHLTILDNQPTPAAKGED